ncbi:MAG: hypothetical protein AAF871_02225 [Pseudomonadota bacterium]
MRVLKALLAPLCVCAAPAFADEARSPNAEPEQWRETVNIVRATEALFERLESESARFEPRFEKAAAMSVSIASGEYRALDADQGPVRNLTGYRITWYPEGQLVGSVDFVGTWQGGTNLICGYVTWDMSYPDFPRLKAVEAKYLESKNLARLNRDDRHQALLNANCAYGEIGGNFELAATGG